MRIGLVIAGALLVVLGAVLLYVPVLPQGSQTVSSSSQTPYYLASVSGFSLTGTIPVSVSWTATSSVVIAAAACTSSCSNPNATNTSVTDVTLQSGTSGIFALNQPDNGYIIMGVVSSSSGSAANATFKITTALTTLGTILLPLGILILILGVVLRSKAKAAPASAGPAAAPIETPAPGGPPAPPPPAG